MAMELIEGVPLSEVIGRLVKSRDAHANIDDVARSTAGGQEGQPLRFDEPTGADLDAATGAQGEPVIPPLSPEAAHVIATRRHIQRCCEMVRDAARALEYAHKQGVTHRDIKPGNLMLDREGRVHVIDFGIARFFEDATITQTGQLVGTPLYMSPEQVLGRFDLDHRSDIYSLGVVLHELLALHPPFLAPTREELLRMIATKNPRPVQWANPAVPQALANIVHRAIAKDRDERYASACDFAEDLERFLGGKPVLAPPYRYRLDEREIAAQRPGWVLMVAAVLIGLAICSMAVGGTYLVLVLIGSLSLSPAERGSFLLGAILVPAVLLGMGVWLYAAGKGLLAGRRWARRLAAAGAAVAVIVALALTVLAARGVLLEEPDSAAPDTFFFTVLSVVLMVVAIASAALVRQPFRRETQEWFDFAERLRNEHRASRVSVRRGGNP